MRRSSEILEELSSSSESRQAFYLFLSRVFGKEMTKDLLSELQNKESVFSRSQTMEDLGSKKMAEGFKLLNGYLNESSKKTTDEISLELAVEYAGLFLGVWGKPPHPSESIYGSIGGTIMQVERDELLELYKSVGLDRSKEFTEPEDHIALELQFMSFLAGETTKAARVGDVRNVRKFVDMQESFLKNHLGKWIGFLTNDVMEAGKLGFYKGVSLITDGFVEEDWKFLKDLREEL